MIRIAACCLALLLPTFAIAQNTLAANPTPATPVVTSVDSAAVADFQKIEDAWSTAINARDQYGLELVLSPLLVDVSAEGNVTTRNQQVADLISTDDKTLHLDQRVVTIRLLGDTAVANGTYVLHHKASSGSVDEKGVFTHVFERTHGNWRCINSQRTSLREDTPGKHKKQSASEMPFHIPIFSKSEKEKDQN
ncbi:MAG TPA: nuclear transport factor 2 family protein [Terracidiphilus sp.]|nr:nuclear transport factor 2 family protein [Terracidiphilus sp.]